MRNRQFGDGRHALSGTTTLQSAAEAADIGEWRAGSRSRRSHGARGSLQHLVGDVVGQDILVGPVEVDGSVVHGIDPFLKSQVSLASCRKSGQCESTQCESTLLWLISHSVPRGLVAYCPISSRGGV